MIRIGQIGIAIGALGIVLAVMGLFPTVAGLVPTPGIGIVQLITIMIGFSLLIMGAYIYAKFTFYAGVRSNLAQQIGVRLALTGLLFGGMAATADVLGFGSNIRTETSDVFFGPWQASGLIGGFGLAALGILIYAISGTLEDEQDAATSGEDPPDEAASQSAATAECV